MRYRFGRAELCTRSHELMVNGVPVALGGRAFDLLVALLERRGRVVSTRELLSLVWPGLAVQPNNLQVQVWALRNLLGAQAIQTVPRRGYRIGEPVQVREAPTGDAQVPVPPRQVPPPAPEGPGGWFIDVGQACAELAPGRLVTLVGPHDGSRRWLAGAVANHLSGHLAMGAWYLEGAQLLASGAPTAPAQLERALSRLARQDALLVLYDAHLAAGRVAELVDGLCRAPTPLQLLATSSHPLGLPGERVHEAPSRPMPGLAAPARAVGHPLRWRPRPDAGQGAQGG